MPLPGDLPIEKVQIGESCHPSVNSRWGCWSRGVLNAHRHQRMIHTANPSVNSRHGSAGGTMLPDFFNGWRRKVGCILLVLARGLMGA